MSETENKDKKSGLLVKIKEHPYATAGIVFAVGAVIILVMRGGGSSASNADNSAAAQAAAQQANDANYLQAQLQSEAVAAQQSAQTQQVQAAANAQTAQVNGSVAVNSANDQAAVDIAGIQAQSQNLLGQLSAALGTTQANDATTLGITQSNNQTTVQDNSISASTQQAQIASNTQLGLGAQQTSVFQSLLGDIFQQPSSDTTTSSAYSGTLPQTAGGHSAATTVTDVSNFLNTVPSTTLFSPSQINKLLNG